MTNTAKLSGGPTKVLFVDDDPDVLTSVRLLLGRHEMEVLSASTPAEGLRLLSAVQVDAVLLDLNFSRGATSGEEGLRALIDIRAQDPDAVVVVVTGHSGISIAVAAMRAGASDFVIKPWSNDRLVATVRGAVELRRTRRAAGAYRAPGADRAGGPAEHEAIVLGSSPAMSRLRALIARAAPTEANVLVLGESGAGKELVARTLHASSGRAAGPFVPVDLSALVPSELDPELFGRRAGESRGGDRTGCIAAAHGGTLFLDEVGRLPPELQGKLLAVIDRRQATPLGGDKPVPADIRVIAASTLPRPQLYSESAFRADLLHRLNTVEISVPPLRDRGDDVLELSRHFLRLYAGRYGRPDKPLSAAAAAGLKSHRWRGNVRALRQAMERAVVLSEGAAYEAHDFPLGAASAEDPAESAPTLGGDLNLARSERWLIEQALQRHHYNVSHAARDLGLTRAALYRRMEKHGF